MADIAADEQTATAIASEQPAAAGETDQQAIVVHEDALDAAFQAASRSIDQLLWHGSADVAKSVTVFGPGIIVLPLFGKVSGVEEHKCLAYAAHPKRVAKGGLMDRVDFESKFGLLAPGPLIHELVGGRPALDKRLRAMTDEELRGEVSALQDWREKANGRLKTLEKRAAWSFLGMPPGSASQAAIKKAFKKKALELHPDKGGDAGRFQLLQEMKELLIVPTVKELEELEKEAKEREAEVEKAKEKEKEREQKQKDKDGEEKDEEGDFSDISSDSSYDVDEQFKKMFPKKKKWKKKEEKEEEHFDGDLDLGKIENFNRDRHEAARRKLHRNFVEMWERAGKLAEEIKRAQTNGGGEALRQLRKFVDRFANLEVSKLKENDPKKAERIFRRFLEQGAEVICAAGAVDPLATVSSVAMQVNYPLLSMAPSQDLEQRCNALLDAVKSLPSIFDKYVMPAEDVAVSRISAARGMAIHLRLLVPDPALTSKRPDGLELPGVSEVKVELPPGSTLADLRAAALHMCRGDIFRQIAPRLFCGGRFISGGDSTPLSDVEALRDGSPVQCLPSNRIFQPKARAKPAAAAATMPQAPAASQGGAPLPAAAAHPEQAADAAAATSTSGAAEDPRSAGRAEAKSPASAVHRASPELLSALGIKGAKPGANDAAEKDAQSTNSRATQEADKKAGEEQEQKALEERRAAERRAKEEVERKAAEDEASEEDPWFDDFFTDAKKAADSKADKQQQEEEARLAAERAAKEKQEEAEEQQRQEERLRRKAEQEAGKSAMEARLRAQKQAQEAKKKLEKEKKKVLEAKRKAEAQQNTAQGDVGSGVKQEAAESKVPVEPKKQPPAPSPVRELAKAKDDPVLTVQRRRTSWDSKWCNPCAGERHRDGSAIFCYPCDDWIHVGDPFDHRSFDLHCEKVGHYGWID